MFKWGTKILIKKNLQEEGFKSRDTSCAPIYLHIFSRMLPPCLAYLAHHGMKSPQWISHCMGEMATYTIRKTCETNWQSLSHRVLQQLFSQSQISKDRLIKWKAGSCLRKHKQHWFLIFGRPCSQFYDCGDNDRYHNDRGLRTFCSLRQKMLSLNISHAGQRAAVGYVQEGLKHIMTSIYVQEKCNTSPNPSRRRRIILRQGNQVWLGLWCFPTNWLSPRRCFNRTTDWEPHALGGPLPSAVSSLACSRGTMSLCN